MKFGVLQFFSWPERRFPIETVYGRAMERVQIMDQTGYDAVWLAEHHFSGYSVSPSVHMMATHIAAHTSNMRIGTAVSLAAFYHPLRLAEEIALLDVLSGGRVNWGAGRGFDKVEFDAFGVAAEDSYALFRENVEIVIEAWKNERLTYEGKYHSFKDVEVLPKPLQQPHPPVWIASSSPSAVEWAGSQGHSILMDPHSPHSEIARKFGLYTAELEKHGHAPADSRDTPIARLIAIGKTEGQARDIADAGAQWMFKSYIDPEKKSVHPQANTDSQPVAQQVRNPDRYLEDIIIHGTPESVTDQIKQLEEEMPLNYLLCAPLSHQTFNFFTEFVLPKFL